jgi:glycosyltransferase involved in cell wall biosynthesis
MKFCFWGDIADSLKGKTKGGGELQIALLAKALAMKGHEVVIIDPYADENFITAEGVKLINVPDWNKGLRVIRLFQYRIPSFYKLLKEQKADYYYIRMRSYLNLLPYRAAKKTKGKFIIGLAHDLDVASLRDKIKYGYKAKFNFFEFLTVWLPSDLTFSYLLKRADHITLQHSGQRVRLLANNKRAAVFPNIFDYNNLPAIKKTPGNYFVHVGSMTMLKGTGNLFELIKILNSDTKIIIIGQPCDSKSEKIYKQLEKIENVVLKGRLGHFETLQLIANAKALINTSNYEGFPNVFLEAWALGIPVISLNVNPGNVFDKFELGIFCEGDIEKMKESIEKDVTKTADKDKLISYIRDFHEFNNAAERFMHILNTV